jgi:solute carrier family 25, member 39/40
MPQQDAFRTITRKEGIHTLWRGLGPTLMMTVPATALYFATYENTKDVLLSHLESPVLRAAAVPVSGMALALALLLIE